MKICNIIIIACLSLSLKLGSATPKKKKSKKSSTNTITSAAASTTPTTQQQTETSTATFTLAPDGNPIPQHNPAISPLTNLNTFGNLSQGGYQSYDGFLLNDPMMPRPSGSIITESPNPILPTQTPRPAAEDTSTVPLSMMQQIHVRPPLDDPRIFTTPASPRGEHHHPFVLQTMSSRQQHPRFAAIHQPPVATPAQVTLRRPATMLDPLLTRPPIMTRSQSQENHLGSLAPLIAQLTSQLRETSEQQQRSLRHAAQLVSSCRPSNPSSGLNATFPDPRLPVHQQDTSNIHNGLFEAPLHVPAVQQQSSLLPPAPARVIQRIQRGR
ncbi:uncharacterized protein [Clytia hemisphaerica]|uniref:uncharacterized protein n=1 Tax=Clytia hemisphaerica TaxID=252671 RepID=UPI0034D76225